MGKFMTYITHLLIDFYFQMTLLSARKGMKKPLFWFPAAMASVTVYLLANSLISSAVPEGRHTQDCRSGLLRQNSPSNTTQD